MPAPSIQSFSRVVPMIYAYNTPGINYHEGWTKIGYTEKQSVQQRIGLIRRNLAFMGRR